MQGTQLMPCRRARRDFCFGRGAAVAEQKVDLSKLAGEIVSDLRASDPGRTLDVHVDPAMTVYGDSNLLRAVLGNLLNNAWKFTAQEDAPWIHVGVETGGGDGKVIFVPDNGAGFDMCHVERLFGAFQRLHSEKECAGTGTVLATVQRVVGRHGGEVWAEAAVGEGAG